MTKETSMGIDVAVAFPGELAAGTAFFAPIIERTIPFEEFYMQETGHAVAFEGDPATLLTFRFGDSHIGAAIVCGSKAQIDRCIQKARDSGLPLTLWATANLPPGLTCGSLRVLTGYILPNQSGGELAYA